MSARAAALAILLAAGLSACGGGSEAPTSSTAGRTTEPSTAPASAANPGAPRPPAPDDAIGGRPGGPDDPGHGLKGSGEPPGAFPPHPPQPGTRPAPRRDERAIRRSVESFVAALNAHDGRTICSLFAPGALGAIELPERRGSCATSVRASIGHAAPGGQPRWLGTRLLDADSVVLVRGGDGRLTGTVVHRFAASREPSIEDDVFYLRRSGARWLIVQPSSTFYRAIGVGDVPLSALAPPRG